MIKLGENEKAGAIEDDYICPACSTPRLAWQTECSECGKKFDEEIDVKTDDELKKKEQKELDAEKFAKRKKGYWRNLDPKELGRIKISLYSIEIVIMLYI